MLELTGFSQSNNSGRLSNLPLFSYLRVVFLSPQPSYFGSSFNKDFVRLKPSYIQWVANFEGIPSAVGEAVKIERNPTIIKKPELASTIDAIDITGYSPLQIFFYADTTPIAKVSPVNVTENYATMQIGPIPQNTARLVSFQNCPFSAFLISGVLVNEATQTASVTVEILLGSDLLNKYTVTSITPDIPRVPLNKSLTLRVTPNKAIDGIQIGLKEINLISVF